DITDGRVGCKLPTSPPKPLPLRSSLLLLVLFLSSRRDLRLRLLLLLPLLLLFCLSSPQGICFYFLPFYLSFRSAAEESAVCRCLCSCCRSCFWVSQGFSLGPLRTPQKGASALEYARLSRP